MVNNLKIYKDYNVLILSIRPDGEEEPLFQNVELKPNQVYLKAKFGERSQMAVVRNQNLAIYIFFCFPAPDSWLLQHPSVNKIFIMSSVSSYL